MLPKSSSVTVLSLKFHYEKVICEITRLKNEVNLKKILLIFFLMTSQTSSIIRPLLK